MPTKPAKKIGFLKPAKTIGFVHSGSNGKHDKEFTTFKQSLSSAGYDEKTNLTIVDRWANDDPTLLDAHANDLANDDTLKLDLIIAAGGSASARATARETNAANPAKPIPVVFTTYLELTRPAANSTGVCARTSELDPERLRQLHLQVPGEKKVGALVNTTRFDYLTNQKPMLDNMASYLGLQLNRKDVHLSLDDPLILIPQAFAAWQQVNIKAAIVTADPLFNDYRKEITKAAHQNHITAIYSPTRPNSDQPLEGCCKVTIKTIEKAVSRFTV